MLYDRRASRHPAPDAAGRSTRKCSTLTPLLAVALALTASSCGGGKGGAGFQMPPVPVEVAEARPQTVRDQFRALGSIESDDLIQVVSELNAVVVRIPFAEGQPVEKGALIAQLDDAEIRAAAERAEAEHDLAASNAERAQKLFETQSISKRELDDAQAALKVAEANEALAKARLAKTRIVAPFSGLIGRRRVSPGAYLSSGDVITDLARVDEMKVGFSIPERYLGMVRPGRPVEVSSPAYPGVTFHGKVSVVDPIVNPDTRTVQLVARIPNRERRLRPGMSADVQLTFGERQKALVVPDEAVFAEGNQSFVYVVNPDSTVTRTAITLGTRDSARVEVVHGLEIGNLVVRAGHQKLFDGAHVMPVPEAVASAAAPSSDGEASPAKGGGGQASAATTAAKPAAKSSNGP